MSLFRVRMNVEFTFLWEADTSADLEQAVRKLIADEQTVGIRLLLPQDILITRIEPLLLREGVQDGESRSTAKRS